MNERMFYHFGSFYGTVLQDNDETMVIRLSTVKSYEEVKKAFAAKGIKGRVFDPYNKRNHPNPITIHWVVEK